MGKPRVVEVREKKHIEEKKHSASKKPKVVEERDYSMLLENDEPDNLILGKRKIERYESVDTARDRLREDMLSDITPVSPPLEHGELQKRITEDRKKRHDLGKKIKKIIGLD
ncbi:MAG: hypothetical protein AABX01_07580 [Candidatus Micrarchaeota archaeon]